MKLCSLCKQEKQKIEFNFCAGAKDALQKYCKACQKIKKSIHYNTNKTNALSYSILYKNENKDKVAKHNATYRAAHSKKISVRNATYCKINADRIKIRRAEYRKNNLCLKSVSNTKRKANKLNAYVGWANDFFIYEIYDLAKLRTKLTGISWHVDHIVPLTSKLVCGLHCEDNLQVIPAFMNISKNNRTWPDMPEANHG